MKRYKDAFFSERKFNSDKWEHYFDIYDHVLGRFYGTRVVYVEIGVQNGGSLEVARKMFDRESKIVGVDVDPRCKALESQGLDATIIIGSQVDQGCLRQIVVQAPEIDILIDDGSHVQSHMISTFINLFPFIRDGGVYLIEDTHTNYSPEHQESFFGLGLYDYFKGLSERLNIDFINSELRTNRYKQPRENRPPRTVLPDICREIFSIEFFDSMIAIRKKKKSEPMRIRR